MAAAVTNSTLPSRDPSAAPAVEIPARWSVLALLGGGGQAEVWLAEDLELGQRVAVKVLRPGAATTTRARWVRELRLGMQLEHPHLIRTLDIIELGCDLAGVFEYCSGGSVGRMVSFQGPQPPELAARWARQCLAALAYLHDQHVVHRDVKPSNLLLDDAGVVKLADLGLAGDLRSTRSGGGAAVGTHSHMPAEQESAGSPDFWWDLHALGVTLHQVLTGRLPARDEQGLTELVSDRLRHTTTDLPWLAVLIDRLLEHRRPLRWPDARHALAALESLPGI